MAPWQSPQLHTNGNLNGQEREILLFLSCLELDQHLVELEDKKEKTNRRKEAMVRNEYINSIKMVTSTAVLIND